MHQQHTRVQPRATVYTFNLTQEQECRCLGGMCLERWGFSSIKLKETRPDRAAVFQALRCHLGEDRCTRDSSVREDRDQDQGRGRQKGAGAGTPGTPRDTWGHQDTRTHLGHQALGHQGHQGSMKRHENENRPLSDLLTRSFSRIYLPSEGNHQD